jgi:hypothetical protein
MPGGGFGVGFGGKLPAPHSSIPRSKSSSDVSLSGRPAGQLYKGRYLVWLARDNPDRVLWKGHTSKHSSVFIGVDLLNSRSLVAIKVIPVRGLEL